MDWTALGIPAVAAFLAYGYSESWLPPIRKLIAKWRGNPVTSSSDSKPSAETLAHVDAICSVPATSDQYVAALRGGLSVSEFMRQLLQERPE